MLNNLISNKRIKMNWKINELKLKVSNKRIKMNWKIIELKLKNDFDMAS